MDITNRTSFKRQKAFSGDLLEWFNKCVDEHDLFRVWLKMDGPEEESDCMFNYIVNIIDLKNGDYLLGLMDYESEENEEAVYWTRLSEISSIALVTNEEDYD